MSLSTGRYVLSPFFFLRLPKSSNSSSLSTLSLYSTMPLSLNPPPRPVLSSTSVNFGALHMLHVDLLAQLTLPHFPHCQSSAANNPLDFSAAALPISAPCFLTLSIFFSLPHRLQAILLAKLTLPHCVSGQVQSPSEGWKFPPIPNLQLMDYLL